MYQSFTGTARRPRQVNLSGRTSTNPFASAASQSPTAGPQSAVASAQHDRLERQRQRARLNAASCVQKRWRGYRARRRTFEIWRQVWDELEERSSGPYETESDSLSQLRRLLLFYNPTREPADSKRLAWYGTRQIVTTDHLACRGDTWTKAYARLLQACLESLRAGTKGVANWSKAGQTAPEDASEGRELFYTTLNVAAFAARRGQLTKQDAVDYYATLTGLHNAPTEALQSALLAPLAFPKAYAGLAVLLAQPQSPQMLGLLRSAVDPQALSSALQHEEGTSTTARQRLWLLGNIIYLAGKARGSAFITTVARLMGSLADVVDFESAALDLANVQFDDDVLSKVSHGLPINAFLKEQVESLMNKDSIRSLLSRSSGDDAQLLARFALTLLRCFPYRSDDIRMSLYLGSPNTSEATSSVSLWMTMQATDVYNGIRKDSRKVLQRLRSSTLETSEKDDWTIILVFLELYTFLLKIMDDEEFMGQENGRRKSAIPIEEVANLVTFLKNLGFTLYFNAAELSEAQNLRDSVDSGLGRHFGDSHARNQVLMSSSETKFRTLAGIPGLTFEYLRGLVTGVLRAIYERDSRRQFLPKDHWLMTSRFDMTSFITGVVVEEESRHMVAIAEQDDGADDFEDDIDDDSFYHDQSRVSSRAAVLRAQSRREREQKRASKRRYLESVAPRLEILQNMPFCIPFETRVQIFRQFVDLDQQKRRNGVVDPDAWRANQMMVAGFDPSPNHPLSRHNAKVRREQEFSDAFNAFYQLGEGLKEPIQITFEDKWGNQEAGIDGGGVTKEFLMSVIKQAFDQDQNLPYFVETEGHLLHPNPTAVEQVRAALVHKYGTRASNEDSRQAVRHFLQQCEFIGRIIGKCLYEGILVDVNFAGFFLKKWALTGGIGSASGESGYRASINDLKDLDEGLYRNLLWLKNAPASDVDDLAVTFTVDDEFSIPSAVATKKTVVHHELVPGGSEKTVNAENRLIYISQMARYRLQGQSALQTNAFLKGLAQIIEPSWLSMFNQNELQTLISGAQAQIDVDDLRANTIYGGVYAIGDDGKLHPSVSMFWDVMQNLEDEDRQRVLKFVTSTPRGPLLGFSHLNPRFSIRDSGQDENRLPSTSTCVNLLKLPQYRSEATLKDKLLHAVRSGAGFDLS